MERVKEGGGGGEERKETLTDKPLDFENHPLGLSGNARSANQFECYCL